MKYVKIVKIVIIAIGFSLSYAEDISNPIVLGEVSYVDHNKIQIKVSNADSIRSGDSVTLYIKTAFGDEVKTGECQVSSVDDMRVYATPRTISLPPSVGQIAKIVTSLKVKQNSVSIEPKSQLTSMDADYYLNQAKQIGEDADKNSKNYSQDQIKSLEEKAIENLQKAVSMESAEAYLILAMLYEDGYGSLKRDYKKMLESIQKSAQMGYAPAQFLLADMYEDGDEVVKDKAQAIYWYKKAAEQGNREAQRALEKLSPKEPKSSSIPELDDLFDLNK
jgi:hypothetical protein